MRRIGFLPLFFTALTVALAVAIAVRISSYRDARPRVTAVAVAETTSSMPLPEPALVAEPEPNAPPSPVATGFGRSVLEDEPEIPTPPEDFPPALVAGPAAGTPPAVGSPATATSAAVTTRGPRSANAGTRSSGSQPSQSGSGNNPSPNPPTTTNPTGQPSTPDEKPPQENDPTSDTSAPQLLSAQFTPNEIRDGEQTLLTIIATDELSGIRSVSGTLAAPTGAVQGFACQKEGDANRFVSRISIPKDAAEGVWQINHLSILDNANNIASFSARGTLPPTANFRVVSSQPDSTGPTLKALWLDKRAMRGGEKNTLFVEADDDKSGVNLVTGILHSPSRLARVGFVCRANGPAKWDCELTAPACADCGEWRLEQMQLQDKANNMTTVRPDNPLVAAIRVDVSSQACDATPPEIASLFLDQNSISNAQPGSITITASLSDDSCGVLSVSGHATGPSPTGAPLHFFLSVTGDGQTWVGKINIPQLLAKGMWKVVRMQVLDKGQNLKTYSSSDPVLANAVFEVR